MAGVPRIAIAIAPPRAAPAPAPALPVRRRSPAVSVLIFVACGILLDARWGTALPCWLAMSALALVLWGIFFWRGAATCAAICVLAAALFVGAGWHHLRWSLGTPDHVAAFATDSPRPVRITGRLVDRPAVVPRQAQELPDALPRYDRTVGTLECEALISEDVKIPISGLARLDVMGHLDQAGVGDSVDVVGQFALPQGARNPGDFDFARHLRGSGIRVVVRCNEPDDVRVTEPAGRTWRGWQSRLRMKAERLLAAQLSPRTAAVGTALLLGTRGGITGELLTAFAESGTMHILAISGANVGVLAGLLWMVARVVGCGSFTTAIAVLLGILSYAFLADHQPPVLRAVLMFAAVLAGGPWFRTTPLVNGLALAALGMLAWNPVHLFDLTAQLSFLAVAALIWTPTWIPANWWTRSGSAPLAGQGAASNTWFRLRMTLERWLVLGVATLAAVWLFTCPLTIARFHLVSPIGLAVNLVLSPLVVLIMWSGYALLVAGLLWPAAGIPFALVFDGGLRLMLWLVEESAALEWGHFYLPGPGEGWLAGYYVCLLAIACGLPGRRIRHWGWRAMLAWLVVGLGTGLVPPRQGELRCTFLSVGHGLSVLVEMPNGKTLLYDAGQLQNGSRARDVVRGALWQRNLARIDAMIISHADVDHFNGVPGLARTIPIGEVFVHPSFLDFEQESVRLTCEALSRRSVPIRLIGAGDRLLLDGRVSVRVRHPQGDARDSHDNANSLVVEIEYAGRRILLTGDLEQEGLRQLLRQPPLEGDVLQSPHHGSRNANTPALADWFQARWVVVSGARTDSLRGLREVYGPRTEILSTGECGAVTVTIAEDSAIACVPFHPGETHD
jgi:competence protein ComEC